MSITRQVTVWCDHCGNWQQGSTTADVLRKELRKKGWIVNFLENDERKDFCPDCAVKRRRKEDAA
jgi:hypothetical protein